MTDEDYLVPAQAIDEEFGNFYGVCNHPLDREGSTAGLIVARKSSPRAALVPVDEREMLLPRLENAGCQRGGTPWAAVKIEQDGIVWSFATYSIHCSMPPMLVYVAVLPPPSLYKRLWDGGYGALHPKLACPLAARECAEVDRQPTTRFSLAGCAITAFRLGPASTASRHP